MIRVAVVVEIALQRPVVEVRSRGPAEPRRGIDGVDGVAAGEDDLGAPAVVGGRERMDGRAVRELPDLAPQAADALGWLEFKWRIPPDEAPGVASVEVSCPGGATTAEVQVT